MKKIFHLFVLIIISASVVAQSQITLPEIGETSHKWGCPSNSLVSNPSTSGGQALLSSTDHGTVNYLKFDGAMIPQNSTVQGFVMWAIFAYHDGSVWIQCSNDNLTVRVGFFLDNNGEPGEKIHEEDIAASVETTTALTFGTWIVKEITFSLSTPVNFHKGFISIASTSSPNCWLMAIDSQNGIPNSYIYDEQGNFVQRMVTPQGGSPQIVSVGFCLVGEAPTSVAEFDQLAGFSVYPNPTTGIINIDGDEEIDDIKIFDTSGRMVYSANVEGKNVIVNTSFLNRGLYILQISSWQGVQSVKIQVN